MSTGPDAVLAALGEHRLVPVLVVQDVGEAQFLADVLVAAGLPVAEVTLRTPVAVEAIGALADRGDLLVGAGTVLTGTQVDEVVAAGARFVVSPGTSRAVVERCTEHGVLALPGAVTATEVQAALELGVRTVKFFPAATSGGPAAVSALSAPFRGVGFVPTGGIGPEDLDAYLSLPSVVAVGGSWVVPPELVARRDREGLRERVGRAVRLASTTAGSVRG